MRFAAALTLVAAVPATLGGLVFWAVHRDTLVTRAIAFGFWIAAAVVLVAMAVVGQRYVWRRVPFAPPEGWVFVTSAVALTLIGIGIDVAGS